MLDKDSPQSITSMKQSLNILHVCSSFKIGGKTTLIRSLIELNKYCDSNHDLLFILKTEGNGIDESCRVYFLEYSWKDIFRCLKMFHQIVKDYEAIMIHSAHPILAAPLFFSKKQIYLFQHGMAVSSGSILKKTIKRIWYSLFPILFNARTICSTEFAFKKAKKLGIMLSRKRNIIIPFGININSSAGRLRDIRNKHVIIAGMANKLTSSKRIDLVLKSLDSYKGKHEIRLKIAGNGPELAYLKELVKNNKSEKVRVEFLGEVRDMNSFYDGIDLFLFPSKNESFGLVVLEALTRYIPVMVFEDVGGCIVFIEDGKNGFVIKNINGGLTRIWKKLEEDPRIIFRLSKYISESDFVKFDIVNTRIKLDILVRSFSLR